MRLDGIMSTLKTIVNDLTGIATEDIDVHTNFLEAGIDSLTLIQASQAMQEKFGVKLSVVQLLEEHSTIAAVAAYLDQTLPVGAPAPETSAPAPPEQPSVVMSSSEKSIEVASAQPEPQLSVSQSSTPQVEVNAPAPNGNGERASGASALERIMSQQLQLMSRQLEMLRGNGSAGTAPNATPVTVSVQSPRETLIEPALVEQSKPAEPPPTASAPTNAKTLNINPAPYVPYQPIEPGSRGGLNTRQRQHLDEFIATYNRRTQESKRITQVHRPYLADSRSSFGFRLLWKELVYPIVGHRSQGARMWDVDGNEYLDIAMGFGIHLFGHSPAFIVKALEEQIKLGMQLGPQTQLAGQVAEMMSEMIGLERVNFCNSGTEAVIAAMRLARTVNRRDKIAFFAGAYHGWSDGTLAKHMMVDGRRQSVPVAPGVPANSVKDMLLLDWDDPKSLEVLHAHRHELAAVMVEPVQSRRPDIQPRAFLHELREFTKQAGIALIFDEMITGFRIHTGGAQAWFGVQADIATYGKVIGGGLPIGAIAGKPEYMDAFDGGMWGYGDDSYPQANKTVFAGAFFKHPLTMAAAVAVLTHLNNNPELLPQLNQRSARLVESLNNYFEQTGLAIRVVNYGSLFRFMVAPELKWIDLFFYHMLNNGIFIWEGRNCFLSTAHTDQDLERILAAVKDSVEKMRGGDFLPGAPSTSAREQNLAMNSVAAQSPKQEIEVSKAAVQVNTRTRPAVSSEPVTDTIPQFSVYYFGNYEAEFSRNKYELLLKGAKFADQNGFTAVWVPERHFHAFGGFSPNPSVVAAALARETKRLQIRAGSVVLPLHHPIRVAEEWSVVDNLSQGRVGISFASGWQPNDFVFAPDGYENRHERMYRGIEIVKKLWRGESIQTLSGSGKEISVKLSPMPMQRELPMWLTGASERSFIKAGEMGTRVLSNLQDQTVEELAKKIALYREALVRNGHDPNSGHVSLLLHTYVVDDMDQAKRIARLPFYNYMKSSLGLMGNALKGRQGRPLDLAMISEDDLEYVLANGYERYINSAALIGTPDTCRVIVNRLIEIGVDEIGCLLDFGVDTASVVDSLPYLNELRQQYATGAVTENSNGASSAIAATIALEPVSENGSGKQSADEARYSIPLTEAQRQVWITSQMGESASSAYNESITLYMRGQLDLPALHRALQQMVDRHESLRVTFSPEGDCQWVSPHVTLALPYVDFSSSDAAQREAQVTEWIECEVQQTFDLVNGPLIRGRIAKVEEQYHLLVLTHHHLVADGESGGVLMRDLRALYSAEHHGVPCVLPSAKPFSEYVQRQTVDQSESATSEAENYWLEQFADSLPILELPTDRPRPLVQTYHGAPKCLTVDPALYQELKRVSLQHNATLLMTLFAVSNILLHRLSGQDDIVVGSPAAGQVAAGVKEAVGYCINMLPIRSQWISNPTFVEYLRTVRRSLLNGYEHQNYSPSRLIEKLNIIWDPSRSPLFSVTFNFDKSGSGLQMEDLDVRVVQNAGSSARFDLCLIFNEIDGELRFECRYNTDLFHARTIEQWMQCCLTLMRGIVANPEQGVRDLPLLTEAEKQQLENGEIEFRVGEGNTKRAHERRIGDEAGVSRQLEESYVAPRDETEKTLAEIWAEVLRLERVGIENKFFNLGGHSLVALQIIARVRNTFQVELTMRHIFESPTVAQLAATITHIQATGGTHEDTSIDSFVAQNEERLLDEIDQLSDQQVDLLLNDILREEEVGNG
jgi:natural product biosynthesis luciferase-like monooxygenase protein